MDLRFDYAPGTLIGMLVKPLACVMVACLPPVFVAAHAQEAGQAAGQEAGQQAGSPASPEGDAGQAEKKYYDVDCNQTDESGKPVCVTDRGTYVGWRTFHANCHVCHGQNGVGSSFAPSLIKHIDKERFEEVVRNGYTGQIGVMPAWGENPNVRNFIDELYAYQQAIADRALKPGRPQRKD